MAKTLPKKQVKKETARPPIIPEKYQDMVYIIGLILSVFIFFGGAIFGGGFNEFDNIASTSFIPYLNQAAKSGEFPLWMPFIFGGMPGYPALLVTGERVWDFVPQIFFGFSGFFRTLFNNDTARIAIYYALYGIGIYLLLRSKKKERFISFISAFAAIFSTWVITWVMIGHNTKPVVFAMFPFIFFFLEKLREKFSLLYAVLLVFAVHIMFEGGHLQMIFYGGIAFGLYLIFELISRAISKAEPLKVLRAAGLLVVAGVFAYLMSADRFMAVQEYTPYSTRGSSPIQKTAKQHQDASGGNDYEYATMWSYSPLESMTFLVPGYFGHGVQEWAPEGQPEDAKQRISTYWGSKESEDSPPYMGIVIFALAILGFIFYRRDTFVQFLLALIIFSWLLAMGRNLPIVYDLFYKYFPSFNKFRAPSMALALMHFSIPVLAAYGIAGIISLKDNVSQYAGKLLKNFTIVSLSFFGLGIIFILIFKSSYFSAMSGSTFFKQISSQADPSIITDIQNFIWSGMITDWLIGGLFLSLVAVLAYFYSMGKVTKTLFFGLLLLSVAVDLWRIDYKRMDIAKESMRQEVFQRKADVFDFIKRDKDIYRVADFSSNPANISAYFLVENINGYHAAKLRVYQDILDVANSDQFAGSTSQLFNPFLWNLMNVKYIVTNRPFGQGFQPVYQSQSSGDYVYPNASGLPRAFFVDSVRTAKQIDILKHLKEGDFNPVQIVFLEKELNETIEPVDSTATAAVVEHKNELVRIKANASGRNFLFISEIYYPAGWTATIDGKETPIIKSNYAFRGIVVPKGSHTIEMKFRSAGFEKGKTLSIILNIITGLAFIAGVYIEWMRKRKNKVTVTGK